MTPNIIGALTIIWSTVVHAESDYLRLIKSNAKYPDTIIVKDVAHYNDKTVCGKWSSKDSYGLFSGYSNFVYRQNVLLSEDVTGNPFCTNAKNKELSHAAWVRLNIAFNKRVNTSTLISRLDNEFKRYCEEVYIKSLCDSATKKREDQRAHIESELSLVETEIKEATRELNTLVSGQRN